MLDCPLVTDGLSNVNTINKSTDMKKLLSILGLFSVITVSAQKYDCVAKSEAYKQLYKERKVVEAFEIWSEVKKNCPKENEYIYTDGFELFQYKIDNAASEDDKLVLVREKMKLYDQYNKYFPLASTDYEVNKAMTLHDNKIDSKEEIFGLLENGFKNAPNSVNNPSAIYLYFNFYIEKFKNDKSITSDVLIEKYTLVNSLLAQLEVANADKKEDYSTAKRGISALAKDVTTCDNLSAYYEKKFSENQENSNWITSALSTLSAKCSAKPIFTTMAEKLYSVQVTSQSSYFMALASMKQKKFQEAIRYYDESAQLEQNPVVKSTIYYTLATGLLSGEKAKSKEYLNKALDANPKMGKAYLYLAQLYTNSSAQCANTEFEKKAIYYLAIQTLNKASIADTKLKTTADKMASEFASKSVSSTDINKEKMNGKSIKIGCWINETITFPAK